ncbi:MAG: hypothetical protein AAF593_03845 [Planctomycetota bacterium]
MTTRLTTLAGGVLLCGWLAVGVSVQAQQSQTGTAPGTTVDTGVTDLDPLATSLRRIDPGNAQFSFESRLTVANFSRTWSPFDPASPTATDPSTGLVHSQGYQFRSPGLRALIDRPEYVPLRNGGEVMVVPANTVFQLTLERPTAPEDTRPAAHENFMDHRLNHRYAGHTPGEASSYGQAYPNLRLERVPVSELSAIPHPSQMRFPQAAFPNGWTEPEPFVVEETPETPESSDIPEPAAADQETAAVEPTSEAAAHEETPNAE